MAIEWRSSAFKHYPQEDAEHAIRHRKFVLEHFDIDIEDGKPFDLFIGPARDGRMLEVFINRSAPPVAKVFHVLHLKDKTKRRAREIIEQRKGQTP
ncbi:hypothetical protein [Microbacterium album]|nr:hypothetical protein [Microbacterium album]